MPIIASITITIDERGQINVNGPIENRMLCFGLLEIAKDVVREACANAEKRVQPATSGELALIAGGKKGS